MQLWSRNTFFIIIVIFFIKLWIFHPSNCPDNLRWMSYIFRLCVLWIFRFHFQYLYSYSIHRWIHPRKGEMIWVGLLICCFAAHSWMQSAHCLHLGSLICLFLYLLRSEMVHLTHVLNLDSRWVTKIRLEVYMLKFIIVRKL